jgi:hypothetical protein
MAKVRTVDFLPEIFQTSTNKQFLSATLDQLVQEPQFKKTQGYVGRRVGPGVNADDKYVVEPTRTRTDYQLEPGVIIRKTDSDTVKDAVTYPGISDALSTQGAFVDQSDRLYTSEYYTWDPLIDFDKFVNYSQYYWLPAGPLSVDVGGTAVPLTAEYAVTRKNGVYTFSGYTGNNPTVTLLRNGNYTFNVAQNSTETVNYRVTASSTSAYIIDYVPNPALTLVRGNTYVFNLNLDVVSPFWIKTAPTQGRTDPYNTGVSRNGAITGTITFTVPQDAPDTLYYASETQFNMQGKLTIIDGTPGTGPGFWIQAEPGVEGVLPWAPNISSRDVLGVTNNGEDLGAVEFEVPSSTAQSFYYGLTSIGTVDLATNLTFSQINNIFLSEFFAANPSGIDGITNLNGRTVVFLNTTTDSDSWENITQYDPLLPGQLGTGAFDTTSFAQATLLTQDQRYGVWQINYVTSSGGQQYIQLNEILPVANLEKFTIAFGNEYSSTGWYKNASGYFEEIPLLTAIKDVLFYQDGTDPGIFGQIRLIDQDNATTTYVNDIIGKQTYTSSNGVVFTNGLRVQFRGTTLPAEYENKEYYVEGVGTAIKLLPVENFVTPEPYTQNSPIPFDSLPFDVGNFDFTLNEPLVPEYLTINRASPDLNAWSRGNRWFHIDVITAAASYNNTAPLLNNSQRAKRPVIEFYAGTRLFEFGTQGKQPVNIVDFAETDAMSNINGSIGYGVDGYDFVEGTRVIFAADTDPQVRDKIYVVNFITPDTQSPLILQPIINLVPAFDSEVLVNQTVVSLNGLTQQGISYYFDGVAWVSAQLKTKANQAPLFDIYDIDGVSFSDLTKYPSTTFAGTKLFSYAVGSGAADPVLGVPLRYLSLDNIGDIVFDNNFYTDTFVYVIGNSAVNTDVSTGFVYQYVDRVLYQRQLGWQVAETPSLIRQQFQFTYDGSPLRFNINIPNNTVVPAIQLFVGSKFILPADYTVTRTSTTTTIVLSNIYPPGSLIEVQVLSDQASDNGFYQVPINLSNNPFNINSPDFTLGTIRTHYESIAQNLISFTGDINGPNNTRDLGNIGRYGTVILQQSAPLTLAGFFMRSSEYNIFKSLEFNDREYNKFKNRLLENSIRGEWSNLTTSQIFDSIVTDLNIGKTNLNSFFYSDMLPSGNVYTDTVYTVTPITTGTFDTLQTYTFTSANFLGLLVYLNDTLLTLNYDYTVATDGPRITITTTLAVGDTITIREYADTTGNYVPNTPTKMGLYQSFKPEIFLDENYVNPTVVIRGHDGSITAAFGDIRDDILLEFERRIFNNLKTEGNPVPISPEEVIPGYFRTTDYTQSEITTILGESFLTWVGQNKIDYKSQQYIASNPFTYNYSQAGDREKDLPLLGAWRGISRYFYDTQSPNYTPWEMLGFSQKPTWWETRYGPAPYTQDNLVLWDDIQAGVVADPAGHYIRPEFVRPNLSTYFIPTGTEGQLLAPLNSVVGQYDPNVWRKSWVVGDGGPAEAAWWSSSSYPFAVMRLLALTRPAKFFSLFADRDLYRYSTEFEQYLYNTRYRLDAQGVQVYGGNVNVSTGVVTPVSKASYINWIVDYNQQLGINSTQALEDALANLDVRLCWRTGSFTDKQYLKIYTERSSPNSLNSSLLLPDESYDLLLYKNSPFSSVAYSAVIIQLTDTGYAVFGYSTTDPYFNIFASRTSGQLQTVSAGGSTVRVPKQYTNDIVQVPYGFVFSNQSSVVDFLLSYGQYLSNQGLIFDTRENGYTLDWKQMANEFLYWANQGWTVDSLINLNPAALQLTAEKPGAVVDNITVQNPENMLLDQNRTPFDARNLIIERLENRFTVTSATNQSIAYAKIQFINYENIVILNNVSIFADLIYNSATGARQNRVYITAFTTTEWNGTLNAQGFVLNQDNVQLWVPNRKYAKGEIVSYKNNYWSAQDIIQPKIEFAYSDWIKSDYTKIQKGLLPNIANKADQLANSYDTQTANLESDNDLLSYGLIGFQPREYMVALNLDDTSQVNLYKQFIGSKGTILSAEIFTGANLGKEAADYRIYENWAVRRGTYGANANRSFVELRLNEALLQSNPSTVQVIEPGETSLANQTILLNNLWRESYKIPTPNFLTTTTTSDTDTALPSAGYVNIDDVDITVFSLDDPSNISANLDTVGNGTRIWVAKTNSYDWNVYRATQTPGRISRVNDNLDGTSLVTFTQIHNLRVGDLLIVRFFNDSFNGVYRVLTIPRPNTITVAYTFPNSNQTAIAGSGLGFYLDTMRVAQASDVGQLSYANDLVPGALAWVDNNGAGLWEVLEKQNVFSPSYSLDANLPQENTGYGSSIAQAYENIAALVGAPSYGTSGAIYPYLRGQNNTYEENPLLQLTTPDTAGYGSAVDIGYQSWAIAGAPQSNGGNGYTVILYRSPASNRFLETQLLIAPDYVSSAGSFGSSVAISKDERWAYIGAPEQNAVYAYARVDEQTQHVEYIGDGVTASFNYADNLVFDLAQPGQITVLINNVVQRYGVEYDLSSTAVIFNTPPLRDLPILILRNMLVYLDNESYYNVEQDSTDGIGSGAKFTVDRVRGTYDVSLTTPGIDYVDGEVLTIDAATIGGGSSPANDLVITVTAITAGAITAFTYSGSGVANTSVFDLQPLLYTATNINSFSVTVDGILQRPYIDYTFAGTTVTFDAGSNPPAGSDIVVESGTYFKYVTALTPPGMATSPSTTSLTLDEGSKTLTVSAGLNYSVGHVAKLTYNISNYMYGVITAYNNSTGSLTVTVAKTDVTGSGTYASWIVAPYYQFGSSVSCSTDGRQVVIGAPTDTINALTAGSTYVYDRSVIRYQVGIGETTTTTFALPAGYAEPVSVLINNAFLQNSDQFIGGEFTVSGGNVVLASSVTLAVGDIIEIESNIFQPVQQITIKTPFDEAQFGTDVDLCPNNCSIYIGAPADGTVYISAGSVQRNVNQARVYGVITSTIANPALTAGDTVRVNNYEVAVPASPDNTLAGLVDAINSTNDGVGIPNAVATLAPDLLFVGNNTTKTFDIGVTYSQCSSYTTVVYVNDVLQTENSDYTYNNTTGIIAFVIAPAIGAIVRVVPGTVTLSVINAAATLPYTRLEVLPGVVGFAFDDIGFENYAYTQTITSPNPTLGANFGSTVFINTDATTVVVGAPTGNLYQPVTFDDGQTYFDDRSTIFSTVIIQSGVTYTFDYLPSSTDSVTNPGQFVFGQQMYDSSIVELDRYGSAISYVTGRLLIGSPGSDLGDSSDSNFGRVSVFENANRTPAWTVKRLQYPVVDVELLNSVYMYDKLESTITSYLDFIDPLQGKILGVARENIDYIGAVDPANYNNGPVRNVGNPWGAGRIGEIWWDTNSVRFIDPNQDDIVYASRRWSQVFPGSSVDIYQWIESDVTPVNYPGPGTPLSVLSYTTRTELNTDNIFATRYYFWVRNIATVNTTAGKKLSTTAIANYIANPRSSGISYLAALNASTVAIYNVNELISAQDTILHIEYDRIKNDDNVHQEYELIADGVDDSFLSDNLYLKLQDSLSGINILGAAVPDPTLSPAERYGVEFRPRQSMFVDRFAALKNYLGYANRVLANYPVSETKSFTLLNSREPEPAANSGAWNARVADLTELGYQNLVLVPVGYRYLVVTDSSNSGFWTIYEVIPGIMTASKELVLIRVQNYDTRRYWDYVNWYAPGYNSTVNPVATVANYTQLSSLTLSVAPVGSSVKVTNAPAGKYEIFQRTLTSWDRVGLEDGTIEFSAELWNYSLGNFGFDVEVFDAQYFDQEPVIETRKIVQAVNQQLFIDELAINRNRSLILMFEFIMSEFSAPDWLMKTSLIDVTHKIRNLIPYQTYRQDNQDFVLNYIQEVKPYHTQIREFNLSYDGNDEYMGMLTDFDNPAFWDATLTIPQFISPVLLPYTASIANSNTNYNADTDPTAIIWTENPWSEWYSNYTLSVESAFITNYGTGYSFTTTVVVTGECVTPAEMTAVVNSAGQIVEVNVIEPGSGYITTPVITFVGVGTGAVAVPVMGNGVIRQIKTTIKYDRYQYSSTIVEWQANVLYDDGTQVRYADRVWQADSGDSFGVQSATFDPQDWIEINAGTLTGVDRTMGFYAPTANQPGLSLPLLIDGVEYPGVQVYGVGYDQYPGFDVAPYDSTPFDNLTYGPEGRPTFDQTILDAVYESPYTDPYLGIRSTSINVEGGGYIDQYSSYAPEELVPGSEFDTLDIRVYTTPGADWARDGHGFRTEIQKFTSTSLGETYSFAGVAPVPATMIVTNQTTGLDLTIDADYTADWAEQTITLDSSIPVGSAIVITLYGIGGGNQLFKRTYNGAEIGNTLVVPVQYSLITEFVIFVNGVLTTDYTFSQYFNTGTELIFGTTYTINDYLMICAIGPTTIDDTEVDYSWSVPVTQYIVGVTGVTTYTLTNSMEYVNPDNLVITVNGLRARTSAGIEYLADGTTDYLLPERLGFSQSIIANNEVRVYVENVPQVFGVDFTIEPYDPDTPRAVMFTTPLTLGEKILICVTTNAQAIAVGNQLLFNPAGGLVPVDGDVIAVTSWNDTRQQDILTQVYVGPVTGATLLQEPYDTTDYDVGLVISEPGSYDYSAAQSVTRNDLFLNRPIVNPDNLWVTLNGQRIFVYDDFTIVNNTIILAGGYIMSPTDVIVITEFTNSIAPEAMAFRIFQDMRGVQATYRITPATTTYLVEPLAADDDIVYVHNAAALNQPDLANNVWGLLTVNGERIMYRNCDTVLNTVSGLRRGTAGTGAADHIVNADVYNISRGNLLPTQYQNYVVSNLENDIAVYPVLGDGSTTVFVAEYLSVNNLDDSATMEAAVEVYIGGTLQAGGYDIIDSGPVTVAFDTAPPDGVQVTILVRRGVTWYAPGASTASNGVALQDTETRAARFLRGE